MDLATFIGIVSAFALVIIPISSGSGLALFFDLPSLLIVLGGTLGATMVQHPLQDVIGMFRIVKHVFLKRVWESQRVIDSLIEFSNKSRKEGILALEPDLERLDDTFLAKGLQLAIDGMESGSIKEILETEVIFLQERHRSGAAIMNTMASFFPAMGMIGTLIGLVQMLKTMDNPATIGPAMAVALLTTFYGAVGANLICLPMAGKLRKRSQEEALIKEMVITGILSIANGENPRIIEQKLHSFLPPAIRASRFR